MRVVFCVIGTRLYFALVSDLLPTLLATTVKESPEQILNPKPRVQKDKLSYFLK